MVSQSRTVNPYLNQKVMSASPEQLIGYVYDIAVAACKRKDKIKSIQAVNLLIKSLRFDYREIATTFYRVYSAILDKIYSESYEDAESMLAELREIWVKAMNL